ncbi:MAG TPA: HAD-IA family hydrolase [Rhizomicrobium sp.]|jgi:HAD superfamily hydrolase (TIGR01509 family)
MTKAVIFDCDGVLVDSEVLYHAVEIAVLADMGMAYDPHDFKARFLGMSDKAFYAALELDGQARLGRSIEAELRERFKARTRAVAEKLTEVKGAADAVDRLKLVKAVASSSTREALDFKLKLTGLWERFAPHIYSAEHVVHAKPAPDLFLHAADALGIAPSDCLVIEDSVNGVRAGAAAGMRVWGFMGGGHMDEPARARLEQAGVERIVAHWQEAAELLAAL